ncbi:type IV secretion system protein [Sphingomonas canadensis]|uniref:Type IV secretion system protein n=1 Tax=Sphingomonas canadensis TaxID=1219257 RepID=A0ABW3HAZ2_9SPHN|nr:type IV secretion system protein [Sphingomonas canadensis]MCW3838428.1 type IV secretion system protein [Sphingomonas canadensis]
MSYCRPLYYGDGFLKGVLDFIDCQAQNMGTQGYQALAAPGSTLSLMLTGLLTLFVAFYGYRMLMGQTPVLRDGVMALAKIGIVLALASSWPAYRALVYDVAMLAPAQVTEEVGRPAGIPGAGGGLVLRLQQVDAALLALARRGVGSVEEQERSAASQAVSGRQQTVVQSAKPVDSSFDPWAIGGSRVTFLAATISALAAVRLVAGFLLALGPFFIAFLLFDATRGLFEGWVRALAGTAIGAVAVTLILGAELALLEPWLNSMLARRAVNLGIPGAPVELLVVTSVFGLAMLAALVASARVAMGFQLPAIVRAVPERIGAALRGDSPQLQQRLAMAGPQVPSEQRSRAAAIAEAVAASHRRETTASGGGGIGLGAARAASQAPARDIPAPAPVPLGQSYGRRARTRVSGSAGKRDRRS